MAYGGATICTNSLGHLPPVVPVFLAQGTSDHSDGCGPPSSDAASVVGRELKSLQGVNVELIMDA